MASLAFYFSSYFLLFYDYNLTKTYIFIIYSKTSFQYAVDNGLYSEAMQ